MTMWQDARTAPFGETVLAGWRDCGGKWITVRAVRFSACTLQSCADDDYEYDEERDQCYARPGWYEDVRSETGLKYTYHYVYETPTHWMPMPAPPPADGDLLLAEN